MQNTTYITNENGKRISAVIPIKKYKHLLEESSELEDIKAFDKAMNRKQELIPLEQALKEIELLRKSKK